MMMLFLSPWWGSLFKPLASWWELHHWPLSLTLRLQCNITQHSTCFFSSQALLHTGTIHMNDQVLTWDLSCFSPSRSPSGKHWVWHIVGSQKELLKWRREKETHIPVTSPQHPAPWEAFTSWASFTDGVLITLDWDACWVPHWRRYCEPLGSLSVSEQKGRVAEEEKGQTRE